MRKYFFQISLVILTIISCEEKTNNKTLFTVVNSKSSGLDFKNQLYEDDSINIIDNEFVYNGAGVALGDLNGDDLPDIFVAGNQVQNQLYLNQGSLKFKNITHQAKVKKPDSLMWSSGVNIIDINNDGLNDIYVCNTFRKNAKLRKNLLYINQGNATDGLPVFKEMATAYGIADTTYSSHAQFFDFDNDGDLDLFIGVNQIDGINPSQFRPKDDDGESPTRDRLFENISTDTTNAFVDVSKKAGIRFHGYSHSTVINDFNMDGYQDIFVSNDFLSNDLLYVNNQDGTFTNSIGEAFKHLSLSSMGSDIADVNNDGRMDLYVTEMQPYYNKRKKLFQGPSNYQKEIFTKKYNYEQQYARNVLHLNQGAIGDKNIPKFNDVGILSGLQETDWSWAPLFADIDNDGYKDLLITNGFPKDVTDRDFGDFRMTASRLVSKQKLIDEIPVIKIPNFVFKNKGGLDFEDVTNSWGLNFGTFSNGAAYADLDNDGDLDFVINNINDTMTLLENNSNTQNPENNWLKIKLNGPAKNKAAFGAKVSIYTQGQVQQQTIMSNRGYLSQSENTVHFGLGNVQQIDSILILWPGNKMQKVEEISIDTLLQVSYANISEFNTNKEDNLFSEVTEKLNLNHLVRDIDFIDFNFQSTIPHKFSQYGPSIAVGDVNADGLDDMFVAASRGFKQKWFVQQQDGGFVHNEVSYKTNPELEEEDSASLLFDADADGDLDLYIARGCAQYPEGHKYYQDQLLLNDGKGNFEMSSSILPELKLNTSVVKAADFDKDGDLDLFLASRVLPFSYPYGEPSIILENRFAQGELAFVEATATIAKDLMEPNLVSDATWTDFNNDNWPDLVVASEWSPLRFFENKKGNLVEIPQTGIEENKGWWNSVTAADLDNDGDVDYIVGNSGSNIYTKGSKEEPVKLYAKDLDNNGAVDPLISYYLRDSLGVKREYLYHPWQDVVKQFTGIRKKFNSFGEFGEQTVAEMFSDGLLDDAKVYELNYMQTSWVENLGNNKFELHQLPIESQLAPVFGSLTVDVNKDGYLDILLVGNDFGMEVQQGPADALNGLVLINDKNGGFTTLNIEESNFYVPGNAKALVKIKASDNSNLIVASQNNDTLKAFKEVEDYNNTLSLESDEIKALVYLKNGDKRIQEFYWGSSFMSQSSRMLEFTPAIEKVIFLNSKGEQEREVQNNLSN